MKIINAAPPHEGDLTEHTCASHETTQVQNPAVHHGALQQHSYRQEFGYQPLDKDASPPEVPEIRVNGVLIAENEVLSEVQHHPAETKREAMVKAAESLIIGELLRQKAVERQLISDDCEKHSAEEASALNALIEQEVSVPTATDAEQRRFYEANKDKFATSPLLEVRHILLAAAPDDIDERIALKAVADILIASLADEPSLFDELVQQHSTCPSKAQNGNLGQISKGQTVPEFESALFAAKEGLIDYPVESRYGFHIVMVDKKIEGQQLPYDYVREKVAQYLHDKVQRKATAHYIQTLIEQAEISGFNFDIQEGCMQ